MTEVMAFMNVVKPLEQFDYIDYIGVIEFGYSDRSGNEYKIFLYIDKGLQTPNLLETPYS